MCGCHAAAALRLAERPWQPTDAASKQATLKDGRGLVNTNYVEQAQQASTIGTTAVPFEKPALST